MNFDGIKFTINFKNEQEKDSFDKFIKTLNIVKTKYKISNKQSKNKKNLKYYTYKLKHECDQPNNKDILKNYMKITKNSGRLIKNTTFEQYGFCDIGIHNLGPDILNIKETNTFYTTLTFKNISYEVKVIEKNLSQEEKDFFKKYYTNNELLTKKRFTILSIVLEYIFNNNLCFSTKIKEINFVHYDFSDDKYKFFYETKRKFINSDCTLDIKKYYFDYPVIYSKDEREYLIKHFQLDTAFNSEPNLSIDQYITNDRIRISTTDKNIKSIEIRGIDFFFKPLLDKESSYIKIDNFLDSKINFTNKRLKQKIVFKQEPFQVIRVKVSGWFTRNKEILQSKNESTKYYYKLSDSTKEINSHINQFLKKYTIYKIQNNQIEEEIIDYDEDYLYHHENEYDYMEEDTFSEILVNNDLKYEMTLEELEVQDCEKDELEEIKKLPPIELINRDIKLNKTIMKKFEKNATVEKIDFSTSLKNLNFILDKYKK
jgi:hypothetical protein